jgi:hypothetical protein
MGNTSVSARHGYPGIADMKFINHMHTHTTHTRTTRQWSTSIKGTHVCVHSMSFHMASPIGFQT